VVGVAEERPALLPHLHGETFMLRAAFAFLLLAIVAALLGFTGIAGTSSSIAQILFVVFLVLFLVGLIAGHRVRA